MRSLRTAFTATAVLAVAAFAVVACAPPPSGGGGGGTSTTTTTTVPQTPPPYQPLGNPPAIGTLKFFNAAGTQITSGNINDAPFAAYVQSSVAGRAGDNKATLFAYLPKAGIDWDGWSGEQLSSSTVYPNGSAPGALASSSLPLVSLTAGDSSIASFQAAYPHTVATSSPYYGLYHLRLKTSGPGQPPGATFAQADIKITGTTWTVVYP